MYDSILYTYIFTPIPVLIPISLYSLDFMRQSAELSEWYGRMYYFIGNPLGLPFAGDMENCLDPLGMLPKVRSKRVGICVDIEICRCGARCIYMLILYCTVQ